MAAWRTPVARQRAGGGDRLSGGGDSSGGGSSGDGGSAERADRRELGTAARRRRPGRRRRSFGRRRLGRRRQRFWRRRSAPVRVPPGEARHKAVPPTRARPRPAGRRRNFPTRPLRTRRGRQGHRGPDRSGARLGRDRGASGRPVGIDRPGRRGPQADRPYPQPRAGAAADRTSLARARLTDRPSFDPVGVPVNSGEQNGPPWNSSAMVPAGSGGSAARISGANGSDLVLRFVAQPVGVGVVPPAPVAFRGAVDDLVVQLGVLEPDPDELQEVARADPDREATPVDRPLAGRPIRMLSTRSPCLSA